MDSAWFDQIIDEWRDAYLVMNHKQAPQVDFKKGWFTILYGGYYPKYRRKQMVAMTENLKRQFKANQKD